MSSLLCLSLVTAVLSGFWVYISGLIGLIGWIGFAGCTTYFAAGGSKNGLYTAIKTNLSGALWAILAVLISESLTFGFIQIIVTVLVTFILCAQSKYKNLSYIPGAFIGCFSVFAIGDNFFIIILSLIAGVYLGYMCDICSKCLFKFLQVKGG